MEAVRGVGPFLLILVAVRFRASHGQARPASDSGVSQSRGTRERDLHNAWLASYDACMCGRYTLVRGDKIRTVFNVTVPADLRLVGRCNIAPSQLAPVITHQPAQLQLFKWGLIPSWAKDRRIAFKMINARSETLADKPAFRSALKCRRCLVPADGFYEWRTDGGGKKTPVYIQKKDESLFAFAGLWDTWQDPQGGDVSTFTIITTGANELLQPIHDRMPVILSEEGMAAWLTAGEITAPEAVAWLKPYPAEAMKLHAVSPLVNSTRNEGSELVAPVSERITPEDKNAAKPV